MTDAVTEMQKIREAEDEVRGVTGPVPGQTTVAGVYRVALQRLGHDVTGVAPEAMVFVYRKLAGKGPVRAKPLAQDSAASIAFNKRYPGAASLRGGR